MNTVELTLKTMRVFLVDSSHLLARGLKKNLAELPGVEIVGETDNLADAVREIRRQTPDVVMLDVSLLGESGRDLIDAVSVSHEEDSPFVMVLGGDVAGFEAGPDILLYKTSSIKSAVAILKSLLGYFQTSEELR